MTGGMQGNMGAARMCCSLSAAGKLRVLSNKSHRGAYGCV